jgi:signal transduction histidine kinase
VRHAGAFLLVGAAALPLLAIILVANAGAGLTSILSYVGLWAVGVSVAAVWLWRETLSPLSEIVRELGAESIQEARWRVRDRNEALRRCEEQRAAMTQLVGELTHNLGEGLMVVGSDLRVRIINARALYYFGVEQVAEGSHLLDLVREPDILELVSAAASGDRTDSSLSENQRGLWEVRATPVREGGAVVVFREVGLVRRSAELRRQFVQDLSHELRSPLAVMRTTVEAMEGEVTPQLADMMIRQVERITRLTDELFELANIESGHVDLRPEQHNLHALVTEVLGDFESVATASGVEISVKLDAGLSCFCDRRGLYRVVSNLVDNAIKYNRDGGWVKVRGWTDARGVHLEVEDNGVGIPAAELGAVMQRFYRIDSARTPGTGGLGLGLAIVKHMVQQMGGNLTMESREGVGTKVTITLPADIDAEGDRSKN